MKQIHIKLGEPIQIFGCDAGVMKAHDHPPRLASRFGLGDQKTP